MNDAAYQDVTSRVRVLAGMAMSFGPGELTEAIRAIDRANSAGAMLDPTTWIGGHERIEALRGLVDAVRKLRLEAVRFQDVVVETEGKAARARREVARGA